LFAEALADTAAVLSSSLQPATVLERLLANVGRVLPHDAADVLLLQDGVARVAEHVGYDRLDLKEVVEAMVLPLDQTPTLQYIKRTGQPLITPDIEKSRLWVGRALRPLRSVVGAPILIDGEFVGVINILSQEPNAFAERDAARLQAFAHQAAIALRNARLYQQLERHSEILEQTVAERTAELRQTKESVEAILDAIGEGVLVLDAQGRIVQVNPALEALTGYREAELVGRSYEVLAPDPTLEESLSVEILQAVQKGESWRGEAAFRPQEGAAIDVALTVAPMQETEREDAGAYVVSVRDITQMKEVERMKDSVLSITAHELRTPLTTMRLFSDLLLNRPPADEERRRQTTVIIHQQTVHLQKIVDDMLDLARLEAGRGLQIVAQPLSVRDVVQEVVQPFAEMTDKHEFQTQDVSPALTVRGDRTRLVQVVRNLVSNAVKYSPHGGTITVRCRKNDEGQVEISVADEGIGMTAEEQQRLFQKFYRADTGSGSPRGTGLGLAICKLIVEGHGGHIWVESEKGVGSTFTLSVPAADA
ncbi:MAG TPA: ATP-binding protein, partial [Candidatus Sulfomarinibacteraceae bacterium]|nr:ATP-binding protein [Candidatus Sulfomarinibacteraceae bacterium]